jgi:hypothetical protein
MIFNCKKLLNYFFPPKVFISLKIGDKLVDKVWGDTEIEILAISKDGSQCRYRFTKIDGKLNLLNNVYSNAKITLMSCYEKLP